LLISIPARVSRLILVSSLFLASVFCFGAPAAVGVAKDPARGLNFFSEEEERAMGKRYATELGQQLRFIQDRSVLAEVEMVGRRLAQFSPRPVELRFFVVDTREVNAFALPGGFIYVNRGLIEMAGSDDELAGVLAHEIAHAAARHSTREMSKKLLWTAIAAGVSQAVGSKSQKWGEVIALAGGAGMLLSTLKYSRNDEYQADALAVDMLTAAGYSPHGLVRFFEKIGGNQRPSRWAGAVAILGTHPPAPNRIERLQPKLSGLPVVAVASGPEFRQCKSALEAMPLPPPGRDVALSSALAALERNAGQKTSPPATSPSSSYEFVIAGDSLWVDTGVQVEAGDLIAFAASGQIQPIKKDRAVVCGADGIPGTGKGFWKQVSSGNTGALVARIRPVSDPDKRFVSGSVAQWQAPITGLLELGVNDDNLTDNIGEYHVVISVRPAGVR
jgi:beta-barrel assembly-enhancing protease